MEKKYQRPCQTLGVFTLALPLAFLMMAQPAFGLPKKASAPALPAVPAYVPAAQNLAKSAASLGQKALAAPAYVPAPVSVPPVSAAYKSAIRRFAKVAQRGTMAGIKSGIKLVGDHKIGAAALALSTVLGVILFHKREAIKNWWSEGKVQGVGRFLKVSDDEDRESKGDDSLLIMEGKEPFQGQSAKRNRGSRAERFLGKKVNQSHDFHDDGENIRLQGTQFHSDGAPEPRRKSLGDRPGQVPGRLSEGFFQSASGNDLLNMSDFQNLFSQQK